MIYKPKHLAYVLQVDINEIYSILNNIDKYYSEWIKLKENKEGKPIIDSKGRKRARILNPSHNRLKVIQKRIQKNILLKLELPDYAYGAVKGRDNVLNVNAHKGKKFHFSTDLRNFFPSNNHHKVFEMFRKFGFSPTVSRILTQLTTYKGRLPQGAPTSSSIANLVFVKTGKHLESWAKKHEITFTSFVDDLTFSSTTDFKDKTPELVEMIAKDGFKISHNKTSYSRNPIITGLHPMNNYLKLPDGFLKKISNTGAFTKEQIKGMMQYKKKVDNANQRKNK